MPDLIIAQHWTDGQVSEFCRDVLTVAAEGGINYWASFRTERSPGDGYVEALVDVQEVDEWTGEEHRQVADRVGIDEIWATLSGIANRQYHHLVGQRYLNWILEDLEQKECCNIDAECADIIVQLAIFGELVYG